MQVLIDGRSVYMPPTSMVDWAALPITLADIERIEVIRGPAAASYGANSVHGVINIITRDAGAQQGRSVSITRGNKGINDVQGQFGAHSEKFDYRMTLGYAADNGYDERTATHLPSVIPVNLNNSNDSNQARLVNYRATYFLNSRDNFDMQFGANRDIQGAGFNPAFEPANPNHDVIINNSFQMLTWLHQTEERGELSTRISHTRNSTRENFTILNPAIPITQALAAERTLFAVQHNLPLATHNRLVYGAEISQEYAVGFSSVPLNNPIALSNQIKFQTKRFFAHDEQRITDQLLSNLGGMWENDGQGSTKFSPRGSLNYHVTPDHTVRIGGSIAYRTPSLTENYNSLVSPYQVGQRFVIANPTSLRLVSEKIISRELGYLGQFNDHASSLDVRIFNDQFGEGIYFNPAIMAFANGASGNYDGFETTLKHSFSHDTNLTLNWGREFAHSNANAITGKGDLVAISLPTNVISALFTQHFASDLSYSLAYYQQSMARGVYSQVYDTQPFHRRVDLRLAQGFKKILGVDGEVAWVVQNLFNDNYTEYVATNVFNQRTYVTLKLEF